MLHQKPSLMLAGRNPESLGVTELNESRRKSRDWEVEVFLNPISPLHRERVLKFLSAYSGCTKFLTGYLGRRVFIWVFLNYNK